MKKPGFGQFNLGALSGAVVGAIGGLFAIALPGAIIYHDPSVLLMTPKLNLVCFLASGVFGWLLGGQIGPRVGWHYRSPRAELIAGALAGLLPVFTIAIIGWRIVAR